MSYDLTTLSESEFSLYLSKTKYLFIDAGVSSIRILASCSNGERVEKFTILSNQNLRTVINSYGLNRLNKNIAVYITGKLQATVHRYIGRGERILTSATLWAAARSLMQDKPLGILEISSSGYMIIGIDTDGALKDDMLIVNPRCGAGSGVNLDRVLQKLNIDHKEVDLLLKDYIGEENFLARSEVNVRADRCGVFASSATISDKNQGIPLDFALAVTLKSEVLKACKKFTPSVETVWLTGGIFSWQFACDCASDYFKEMGITDIKYDKEGELPLKGLAFLEHSIGEGNFAQPERRVIKPVKLVEYPAMTTLKKDLSSEGLFYRVKNMAPTDIDANIMGNQALMLGLDVGSTMAKLIISDDTAKNILYKGSYSNAGDTIDTIKQIFIDLKNKGMHRLTINQIGLTGSARYQVKKSLTNIYPELADRVTVLVENYAHARGSMEYAREHIERLKAAGKTVNEEFCLLIDIGGEDTKISSISLKKGELYDNAMNVKCSAGTGSLMDTLSSMFYLDDIGHACDLAFNADKGYVINATCAVFLMENARKLQADGYSTDEILASANWAIVENMARTLWNQIELPANTVALLHGQTMLSDPLPLAVTYRLQSHIAEKTYALVPPEPGHRACIGLVTSLTEIKSLNSVEIELDSFINKEYSKKIIQCKGAACGDASALCNRSHLSSVTSDGKKFSFNLGGCTAINEFQASRANKTKGVKDTYKQIWEFIDEKMPSSEDDNRLVIPRSFAVSEWAMFFSKLFTPLGIPVDVDTIHDSDIINAQPHFHIDTCAPHIGVVGQFIRLSSKPHGVILAPQIEFLPVKGNKSLGRTCTINQGGFAVATKIAEGINKESNIKLFYLDLKSQNAHFIAKKIYPRLASVFAYYNVAPTYDEFIKIVEDALHAQKILYREAADYATTLAKQALEDGREIALVLGREYILNPGIYDSHVGRLLRDKNMAGIPSYLLDADFNADFKHLYWRNPHMLATLADASARRELHKVTGHEGLKKIFKFIEVESDMLMPVVQVSTFLCGPDSVTNPLINELTKQRPFLQIQSDAIIKELAHLENRMNTYVKQLKSGLHDELKKVENEGFEIKVLDSLVNNEPLNAKTDVIYFPTLSDNRVLTSVIRGAGYTCIDLYSDDYDLEEAIKAGRTASGDSVCAPLAAVYGDVMTAMEDFKRRKKDDPSFKDKTRLLIFNNKGLGPCRQGQYVETHKIYANQKINSSTGEGTEKIIMQFLVGQENQAFNTGFDKWVFVRGIQSVILQGVLHQLLSDGSSQCYNYEEYLEFKKAYDKLKIELSHILENQMVPSSTALSISKIFDKVLGVNYIVNYFAFGLYRTDLKKPIRAFAKKWCSNPLKGEHTRIHVDGEAYMRIAQFEIIQRTLLATLGFRQFKLTHAPLWSFLDYKLAGMLMRAKEAIRESNDEMQHNITIDEKKRLKKYKHKKQLRLVGLKGIHYILRNIIAKPLYDAAFLDMPEDMPKVLDVAESVIQTKRPGGELVPYIGETVLKLQDNFDLILNVAPEGCMVSSMGEAITPGIHAAVPESKGKIQHLFSQQGDIDDELIQLSLLKTIGPERYYKASR
jgi:activator of 2-hydroxyglutaryl-CoA dehydratase/predicted nucleotide-binding protein (sugar kinase/HSP70/actin superfamily)